MKSGFTGAVVSALAVVGVVVAAAPQPTVGQVAFANSGAPAAQESFLYGLAQLHNFEYDDVEATAFYGIALLGSAHEGRDQAVYMRAAAALEEAFATHPDHPGLAHYLWSRYLIDTGAWTTPLAREALPLGELTGAKLTRTPMPVSVLRGLEIVNQNK